MKIKALLISHDSVECGDERVSAFLRSKKFDVTWACPAEGKAVPAGAEPDALVIFGGKYGVPDKDRFTFLKDEMGIIGKALKQEIPVLGICLGAQLLAHELGAEVGPHREDKHEYGYYPLHPTRAGRDLIPEGLMVLQSHYHQFGIPAGAELLASTELYENQAFRYGARAFGLQFHPEASHRSLTRWIERRGERNFADGAHPPQRQLADHVKYDEELGRWFTGFLDPWVAPALAKSQAA
jgi:GMP synthase (glutamine-hydrolysing)